MKADLLYTIFEQHLFNALVEDECTDALLARVVRDYMGLLRSKGAVPMEHMSLIEEDLKEEVLEMLRKKTYGHFSLADYRRSRASAFDDGDHDTRAQNDRDSTHAKMKRMSQAQSKRSRKPC